MRRTIAATVTVAVLALGPAAATAAAPQKITGKGVGQVKLGKTFAKLRQQHLVGKLRDGCELSGPNTKFSKLRSPLRGTVDWSRTGTRKARRVTITGGSAAARGVRIGDKLADIKAAFPQAKVDHAAEPIFGITLVKIPKNGGGRMWFGIPTDTKKITMIGVPNLSFCD
jgi:hypothetical protein